MVKPTGTEHTSPLHNLSIDLKSFVFGVFFPRPDMPYYRLPEKCSTPHTLAHASSYSCVINVACSKPRQDIPLHTLDNSRCIPCHSPRCLQRMYRMCHDGVTRPLSLTLQRIMTLSDHPRQYPELHHPFSSIIGQVLLSKRCSDDDP